MEAQMQKGQHTYLDVDGVAPTEEERTKPKWRAPPPRRQQCWRRTHNRINNHTAGKNT